MTETQRRLLLLLDQFDEVCKKHHIIYYLEGGTALGAVRNHGFLPWDDDLDVCMKKSEFDKLLAIRKEFEEKDLDLVCHQTYPEYNKCTVKLNDNTTSNIYRSHILHGHACGQHIDIFVLDPVPAEKDKEFLKYFTVYMEILNYYYVTDKSIADYMPLYQEYVERCRKSGRQVVLKELEERLFSYAEEDSDHFFFRWGEKQYFLDKDIFQGEPVPALFEGRTFPLAPKPAAFLRGEFGEGWKNVPPKKERQYHYTFINYNLSSNNIYNDLHQLIDKTEVARAYRHKKPLMIEQIPIRERRNKANAKLKAVLLRDKVLKRILEGREYKEFIGQKRLKEAKMLLEPFYTQQWNLAKEEVLPPLDSKLYGELLELQIRCGEYAEAETVLLLLKKQGVWNKQLDAVLERAEHVKAVVHAGDDENWDRVAELLPKDREELTGQIDYARAYIRLKLCETPLEDLQGLKAFILVALDRFAEDGDLMKLYGDMLYMQGQEREARNWYYQAAEKTRNGLTLLELKERHGIIPMEEIEKKQIQEKAK